MTKTTVLTALAVGIAASATGAWWFASTESAPSPRHESPYAGAPTTLSGKEIVPWDRPRNPSTGDTMATASTRPAPISRALPIDPSRPLTLEASQEAALNQYDKQVNPTTIPLWWSDMNVHAEIAAIDPGSSVTEVACSREMCRLEILHSYAGVREGFQEKLARMPSFGGMGGFRQPEEEPNKTFVYLLPHVQFREGASEEEIQAVTDALVQKLQL